MNRRRRTDEPVKNIHKETEYHTVVTDDGTQDEGFNCKACGKFITVRDCGTNNRNHCPHCLSSIHLDNIPGDRSADCGGIMEPISIYVRPDGEWALIHLYACRSGFLVCACLSTAASCRKILFRHDETAQQCGLKNQILILPYAALKS